MWNFKYKNQYLNYVSDLMQDTAVQSMRLLPQHRAGVSCYHHSVLVSYASWRVCDWLGLEGRRLPSGYPPRLPAPGGGPAQRQGPLLPHLAGGGHHPLPHVSLYPHQGVPLPGIGGGKYHGQAVCRRRAGRAGAPAHPLPPGDPLLAGRRLGSYPAAQGRRIFIRFLRLRPQELCEAFLRGRFFDRLSAAQWAALFSPFYGKCT